MATSKNSNSEPLEYQKWDEEQDKYWAALRQKLQSLKEELDSSDFEVAQGLGISRQIVASFMDGSRTTGLPINRSSLLKLWWYLTDEKSLENKRLSKEAKQKRLEAGKQSPDELLKAAGFLPTTSILSVNANIYPEVSRVVTSLRRFSGGDRYASDFSRLIKNIKEEIRKAFLFLEKDFNGEEIAKKFLKNQGEVDEQVKKQFLKAESKLLASGKDTFTYSELIQLLQAIEDNAKLKNSCLRMRISECEFTTLTFSLQDYYSGTVKDELNDASKDAEKEFNKDKSSSKDDNKSEKNQSGENQPAPVIMASITCCFSENREVCWQYSSNASHFENMLAALEKGLGHLAQLELIHFSNTALGKQDYSLAENSVVYKNNKSNQRYSGVWVDKSIVIGSLQAVLVAVRTWLCELFEISEQQQNYYKVCQQVAEIEKNIWEARTEFDDCSLKYSKDRKTGGKNDVSIRESLREEIDRIQNILKDNKDNKQINDLFENNLQRLLSMAYLINARLAHAQGNLQEAKTFLDKKLWEEVVPIKVLKNLENKAHNWLSGSSKFDYKERADLDNELKEAIEALHTYIYKEDLKFGNYKGRFDFDVCLAASELFGSVARLDFYFCQVDSLKDVERLKKSIPNFLKSAYYSAKIGRRKRAAQWLSYLSRTYSRLGEEGKANAYADIARNILIPKVESEHKDRYQLAILADVNLALGEKFLIKQDPEVNCEAIGYFLKSLTGAIYLGFVRIMADSLYGIARAARNSGNYIIFASLENSGIFDKDVLSRKKDEDENAKKDEQTFQGKEKLFKEEGESNKIVMDVISFFNRLNTLETWSKVANDFEERAKDVWHQLLVKPDSEENSLHPIEEEIARGKFLDRVE